MKLYFVPKTRAVRVRWLLEEMGRPYELVRVDVGRGDLRTPSYLAIHPLGRVPALVDGDVRIFEAAAILLYLTEKFPAHDLAPTVGAPDRTGLLQWLFFACSEMEEPIRQVMQNRFKLPEPERIARLAEQGQAKFRSIADVLSRALDGRDYLLGRFTIADITVGGNLIWARRQQLLDAHPQLNAYCDRLTARPAYRRANED